MQVFCVICAELYQLCLKPSKMEGISSNDRATLIRLKKDGSVKIHDTMCNMGSYLLWEQSDIISENYCWIFLSFLFRSILRFLFFLQIVVEQLMCYFFFVYLHTSKTWRVFIFSLPSTQCWAVYLLRYMKIWRPLQVQCIIILLIPLWHSCTISSGQHLRTYIFFLGL